MILVDVSPVYRTKPVSDIVQDDFLNLVVVAESTLEPLTLLDRVHAIEKAFGRIRDEINGPRTLDIDIIMVPEVDNQINALGVKGIGELANVGTPAAITDAIWHATGIRVRDLPVRIEDLL